MITRWFKRMMTPQGAYEISGQLLPWLVLLFIGLFSYGLIDGLFIAPADYQQGNAFRIMYVHVPSAMLSLAIYTAMAIWAVMSWVWRIKMAAMALRVSASLGAWFTFLALVTGSIWGKPMWGTWWVWDARLTSMLILLFIYLGIISLQSAIPDTTMRDRATALLTIIGVINIPVIHYSVIWWNTLHQDNSISFSSSNIVPSMLHPLLAMLAAFCCFYVCLLCLGMRYEILKHYGQTQWLQKLLKPSTLS